MGDSTGSQLDITTTNLTMRTAGGISGATSTANLLIHAAQFDVITSALGDVHFSNVNSAIVLKQVVTKNGLISIQSNRRHHGQHGAKPDQQRQQLRSR